MAGLLESPVFIQAVGFAALALCVLSYQSDRLRVLLGVRIASEAIFGLHYLLLGVLSGAAIQFVGGLRYAAFLLCDGRKKRILPAIVVFCIIFTVTGILTWDGPLTLIPIAAKNVSTIAFGMSDTKTIRRIELPTYLLWIVYNTVSGSISGVINATLSFVSIAVAMARFDLLPALRDRAAAAKESPTAEKDDDVSRGK